MYGFLIPVNQIIFCLEYLLLYFVSLFELISFYPSHMLRLCQDSSHG